MQRGKAQDGEERPHVFLCDNGSLVPAAIRALGAVAGVLGHKTGRVIRPIGLLHSDRVEAISPDDGRGTVLLTELPKLLVEGARDFLVLPFFLGPSRGITEWLPAQLDALGAEWPDLRVGVAPWLHEEGDDRLPRAISERVRQTIARSGIERPFVALVDHGTPAPEVNLVRELVGDQVGELLGDEVAGLRTCSMERRPGPEYDFNDPLLENLLPDPGACPFTQVVVAQFFLSPGRHAGPDGDVANICREAEQARPGLQTFLTHPLGDHPLVLEILEERLRESLDAD